MALRHERPKTYKIKIRKGDQVKVIAGPDLGRTGRVLAVNNRRNTVVVEHVSIIKRHTRANPGKNISGGIVEKEGPISASNVMVVCSSCGKHTRIGSNVLPDGTKVRACRRCGTTLDN
ncbi:MAG TPA: 50S ribosomal protein L24 [Candidatus Acidoferrum sp.]|nr:50S ribosomal protein L24 [Candidatus Acidoferrum sp.]